MYFYSSNLDFLGWVGRSAKNEFYECKWAFKGQASHTIKFMEGLYNGIGGGRQVVEATFENIRNASSPTPPQVTFKPTIFLGHGGSALYRDLENFLQHQGFIVETFESSSWAGYTAKEVIEQMAKRASITLPCSHG